MAPVGYTDNVPDDYDVTITSTTDDEKTVRAAAGLAPVERDDDEADEEAGDESSDEDAETDESREAAAEDEEEAPAEEAEEKPHAKRRSKPAIADRAYEDAVEGETPEQSTARIERNVKRIIALNQRNTRLSGDVVKLREENATLRGRLEGRATPAKEQERRPVDGTDAAPVEPKFAFPDWETWAAIPANEGKTNEDYTDARSDARFDWRRGIETAKVRHANEKKAREATEAARVALVQRQQTRTEQFKAVHADYDAVLAASDAPMTDVMHMAMLQHDRGEALAYYFSKDKTGKQAAMRIAKLQPMKQIAAIENLATDEAIDELMAEIDEPEPTSRPARRPARRAKTTREEAPEAEDDEPETPEDEDEEAETPPRSRREASGSRSPQSRAPKPLGRVNGGAQRSRELKDLTPDEYIKVMDDEDKKRGRRR